jgi:hypothetical protein
MAKREHGVSTDDRIPRKVYEVKLDELSVELVKMQYWRRVPPI